MKRIIATAALLAAIIAAPAQTEIKFSLSPVTGAELQPETLHSLNTRLLQALNRTSAASEDPYNVFTVEPVIEMAEAAETEGLMQEVGRVAANLTLTARNSVDGVSYYSITVPLKGSAVGGKKEAEKNMARSLKPTDAVYVRFVRTARQKISEHYAANCALILQRAQLLASTGKPNEALSYLTAVPVEVDCFESASALMRDIHSTLPAAPDTVYVEVPAAQEEPVETPVDTPVETPVDTPVTVPADTPEQKPAPAPAPEAPKCTVTVESDDLFFRILSCTGNTMNGRITINAEIINLNPRKTDCYTSFREAFTGDGIQLKDLYLKPCDSYGCYLTLPTSVPVKAQFYITGTTPAITSLAHLLIIVRDIKVTIRNLPVQW